MGIRWIVQILVIREVFRLWKSRRVQIFVEFSNLRNFPRVSKAPFRSLKARCPNMMNSTKIYSTISPGPLIYYSIRAIYSTVCKERREQMNRLFPISHVSIF